MNNYIRTICLCLIVFLNLGVCQARKVRRVGQKAPEPRRVREIQAALVRNGYRGPWKDAMRQYQKDHGWQSKVVPDARALISLGLGPRFDNVLNPQTAWVANPYAFTTASR